MEQEMSENLLYRALKAYTDSDAYPFHMPGHKRNRELLEGMLAESPYGIDITEISGFDNLHHAEGILREGQERAARLYGAQESFFLVNGSTCGILAAIFAVTTQGGKLLMARNCHKAAYHAAELRGLRLRYLYPKQPWEDVSGFVDRKDLSCREERAAFRGQRKPGAWRAAPTVNGLIAPEDVETALREDPEIQAVFLTSPTYDGVVSDISRIAQIAHRYGKPLVVDEAHGAHFGFHPYFPDSSVHLGADLVIHSLHKTLPSLTQTALLHVGRAVDVREEEMRLPICGEGALQHVGRPVDVREEEMRLPTGGEGDICRANFKLSGRIRKYLDIFETSSPSYVLMAGIDQCVELIRTRGDELFAAYAKRLSALRRELAKLRQVHLFPESMTGWKPQAIFEAERSEDGKQAFPLASDTVSMQMDPSKLILSLDGCSGQELAGLLRERYHLEMEMEAPDYVIALTSLADTQEGFDRLLRACRELDAEATGGKRTAHGGETEQRSFAHGGETEQRSSAHADEVEQRLSAHVDEAEQGLSAHTDDTKKKAECADAGDRDTISKAVERETESVLLENCAGRISAEYIYLYPPGIPLAVPGEELTEKLVEKLLRYRAQGLKLEGMQDYSGKYLKVCIVP